MFGVLRESITVVIVAVALVAAPWIFVAGVIFSATFVSNLLVQDTGVEDFEGEEKTFANTAAAKADEFFSEVPGPGMWTTGYRVVEMRACPNPPKYTPPVCRNGACHVPRSHQGSEFSAELQTYTFFGIPTDKVIMDCEGTTSMSR